MSKTNHIIKCEHCKGFRGVTSQRHGKTCVICSGNFCLRNSTCSNKCEKIRTAPKKEKYCPKCEDWKDRKKDFHRLQSICKPCKLAENRIWSAKNKQYWKAGNRSADIHTKLEVLRYYSNGKPKCSCCGEKKLVFLNIDHIWGAKDSRYKMLKHRGGYPLYRELRKYKPKGFRVLCSNCNQVIGHYGKCAHTGLLKPENEYQEQKRIVIKAYGGKCVCCDETETAFLSIDHVNGGGHQHRKKLVGDIYRYLSKKILAGKINTNRYQLLCLNCNQARGSFGKCCTFTNKKYKKSAEHKYIGYKNGEGNHSSKLKTKDVIYAWNAHIKYGTPIYLLAKRLNVSGTLIKNILARKAWVSVTENLI